MEDAFSRKKTFKLLILMEEALSMYYVSEGGRRGQGSKTGNDHLVYAALAGSSVVQVMFLLSDISNPHV